MILLALVTIDARAQSTPLPFQDTINRPANISPRTVLTTLKSGMWVVSVGDYYAGTQSSESGYFYSDLGLTKVSLATSGVTFTVIPMPDPNPVLLTISRPANLNADTILYTADGRIWRVTSGSYYGGSYKTEQAILYSADGTSWLSYQQDGVVMAVEATSTMFRDSTNRPANINPGTVLNTSGNGMWIVKSGSYYAGLRATENASVYLLGSTIKMAFETTGVSFDVVAMPDFAPITTTASRPANVNPDTIIQTSDGGIWKVISGSYYAGVSASEGAVIYWDGASYKMSLQTSGTVFEVVTLLGSQSISFTSAPSLVVGAPNTVTATGGASGSAVTFSSSTPLICTVVGSTVTALTVGTCIVAANQPGNANYTAAQQATQTLAVSAGAQSIRFIDPESKLFFGALGSWFEAVGGASGNLVTLQSLTPTICTVSSFYINAISPGTCVVAANQAGNSNYADATELQRTFVVDKFQQYVGFGAAPKLTIGSSAQLNMFGTSPAADIGPQKAIVVTSSTPSICTVADYIVTAMTAGDCVLVANQAGDTNYTAALQATQVISIGQTGVDLFPGWNLLGNASDQPVAVDAVFADKTMVNTVWKWDTATPGWQFYTPTLSAAELQTYASGKGYGVLTSINPGEGFWVNASAKVKTTLPALAGIPFYLGASQLVQGWNLVATASNATPAAFNLSLTDPLAPPPSVGTVPINLATLWAWDNPQSKWYFFAPNLEGQGGTALFDYTASKGYLDFAATSKTLESGMGFWVNKP